MPVALLAASLTLLAAAPDTSPAVPKPPAAEIRYLALGDSFTAGTGNPKDKAFPARLEVAWRAAGRPVETRNLARNGYTTQDVLDRELPQAAGFRPTLVTLAVGANDLVRGVTGEQYRARVRRILEAVRRLTRDPARIVTLPQPDWSRAPVASSFGAPDELRSRIVRFNVILREETEAAGGRYVDLWPLMRRQAEAKLFASDGLHPNAEALQQWADALARQVTPK